MYIILLLLVSVVTIYSAEDKPTFPKCFDCNIYDLEEGRTKNNNIFAIPKKTQQIIQDYFSIRTTPKEINKCLNPIHVQQEEFSLFNGKKIISSAISIPHAYDIEFTEKPPLPIFRNQDRCKIMQLGNDEILAFVADGHSGDFVSHHLYDNFSQYFINCSRDLTDPKDILQKAFNKIDDEVIEKMNENNLPQGGSTMSVCYITPKAVYIAHVGDSRIMCIGENNEILYTTDDHTINSDDSSINAKLQELNQKNSAYYTVDGRLWMDISDDISKRIQSTRSLEDAISKIGIQSTRSIGDPLFKKIVSCCPAIHAISRNNVARVVMASDGFWEHYDKKNITVDLFKNSAAELVKPLILWNSDDLTVVVIDIPALSL